MWNYVDIVIMLLKANADVGVRSRDALLDHEANVNAADENSEAPLHVAVTRNAGNLSVAKLLLAYGADVDAPGSSASTPLVTAALYGRDDDIIGLLLTRFPNVNAANSHGMTALHAACRASRSRLVAELLALGADVNTSIERGESPLYRAALATSRDVMMQLLEHGADVNAMLVDGRSPLNAAIFARCTAVAAPNPPNSGFGKSTSALIDTATHEDCGSIPRRRNWRDDKLEKDPASRCHGLRPIRCCETAAGAWSGYQRAPGQRRDSTLCICETRVLGARDGAVGVRRGCECAQVGRDDAAPRCSAPEEGRHRPGAAAIWRESEHQGRRRSDTSGDRGSEQAQRRREHSADATRLPDVMRRVGDGLVSLRPRVSSLWECSVLELL
ncbi:hypothetical protein PybrP1_006465, partial [[Pythium] brassicae (nom. inval.)]